MKKAFVKLFCFAVSVGILIGVLYFAKDYIKPKETVVEKVVEKERIIRLPGEVEKRVITEEEVESKLREMSELTTYASDYTVSLGKDESRYLLENVKIPGTTNSIKLTASGVVKVGYDISDIGVKVDNYKIYVSIPEAKLNDNYVIWDSVKYSETNSILNPINFSQYEEIIGEIEEKGLKDVESQGIYNRAEENLKKIMNGFFSEFVDYEVIYL